MQTRAGNSLKQFYYTIPFESFVWITALILLAVYDPGNGNHFSLCFFNSMGLTFCPGCGLGHSIAYLFQGEFVRSFQSHPLGFPAVIILSYRIFIQSKEFIQGIHVNKNNNG